MVTSKKTPFDPKSPIASQWYCCYSAQASASGTSPSCTSAHDVAISPTSSSSGAGAGAAAGAGAVPSSSKAGGAVTGAVASSSTAATVGTSETTGAGAVATSETTAAAAVTGGGTEEIANSSTSDADADVQAQTEASTTVGSSTTAEVAAEVETASGDTRPVLNNIISEKYLAEGDDAGDADDVSSEVDEIIGFFNTVNDRNHDIMPLNIGLITSSTGEELRIILSKVDSKEYINIRGTCLPYSDMKKMFEDFDFMEETIKDAAPKPQTTSLQQWLLIFMLSFSSFLIIYDAYMPKLNS